MPIFTPFVYREPLLSGEAGTAQTVRHMRELIDEALRDPAIIRLATDLVRGVPAYDDAAEAQAIYDWVKANIRFTKDPVNKEKLYPPSELLKIRAGDCDDISMLMATLLMAVGYPARLVTVSANAAAADQFSHVYVEGQVQGQWIPMDAARPEAIFGSEPPMYFRKRAWSLTDDSYEDLSGARRQKAEGRRQKAESRKAFVQTSAALGYYPRFRSLQGLGAYGRVRTLGQGDGTSTMMATVAQDATEQQVYIEVTDLTPQNLQQLRSAGATLQILGSPSPDTLGKTIIFEGLPMVYSRVPTVQANVPSAALQAVKDLPFVKSVGPPVYGFTATLPVASGQDPWASFRSRYTPYGPPAGYASPGAGSSAGPAPIGIGTLLFLGLGIWAATKFL